MDAIGPVETIDLASAEVAGEKVWAMGPMTKGKYWEIIAVPDIRRQAAAVAEDVAAELEISALSR